MKKHINWLFILHAIPFVILFTLSILNNFNNKNDPNSLKFKDLSINEMDLFLESEYY